MGGETGIEEKSGKKKAINVFCAKEVCVCYTISIGGGGDSRTLSPSDRCDSISPCASFHDDSLDQGERIYGHS